MEEPTSRSIAPRVHQYRPAGTTALLGSSWIPVHGSSRQSVHGARMHDCPDSCAWIVKTDTARTARRLPTGASRPDRVRAMIMYNSNPATITESEARVRVYNARGSVEVRAEVIDAMRPNVVPWPTDGGHRASVVRPRMLSPPMA